MEEVKKIVEIPSTRRANATRLAVFIVIAIVVFVTATVFNQYLSKIIYVVLGIELMLIALVAWIVAGHAVMKSLFWVGVKLSLIIFLAKAYCDVPGNARTGNDALKLLIGFGLLYITFDFFRALYKEVISCSKTLRQIDDSRRQWLFLVPFAIFIGMFLWQIYQVIEPIIKNLCVYN